MANNSVQMKHSFLLLNLRFAAKVLLTVGAVSCLGAVLVLIFVTGKPGESYSAISRYYSLGRQYLGSTLLVVWLLLVSLSGLITWGISLYTSSSIVGPLHRFARNIEVLVEQGPVTPVPTRKTDQLKQEEQQIERSIARLQQHYGEMRTTIEAALSQSGPQLSASITKLKELDHEARL